MPDSMECSAGGCCEQCFCQEKGTDNPVIRAIDLALENWSHIPEVA